jgi:outer membrane protein assembly factor BamD
MIKFQYLLLILILIFNISCSKNLKVKSIIKEKDLNSQVLEAYEEGRIYLEKGDALFAAKKFNEAEILFPQSEWAPKSALMAAFAYYSQDYFDDAIMELKRFIRIYPNHKNTDYAYYLLANSYYEKIVDEKKDLQSIKNSRENFEIILNKYTNSDYYFDSRFKVDLINDTLASKEMYVGRYYFEKKKWIPAINRFRTVIDDFENTIYVEEALYRLVEVYYLLGLVNESRKYASLLGYNYQSSEWYERSYSLFDKIYAEKRKSIRNDKKKRNIFLKKIGSLFDLNEKKRN